MLDDKPNKVGQNLLDTSETTTDRVSDVSVGGKLNKSDFASQISNS